MIWMNVHYFPNAPRIYMKMKKKYFKRKIYFKTKKYILKRKKKNFNTKKYIELNEENIFLKRRIYIVIIAEYIYF